MYFKIAYVQTYVIIIFCCSCYASFIRYGFVGAMIAIYGNNRLPLKCSEEFCYLSSPKKILQLFDAEHDLYWISIVALFGFILVIKLLAYFILRWKLKSKL